MSESRNKLLRICLPSLVALAIVSLVPVPLKPPISALALALITRKPALALSLGALLGVWLLAQTGTGIGVSVHKYWLSSFVDVWHLSVMGFALVLLGLVQVMTRSGGTSSLLTLAVRRIRSRRGAKMGTAVAGLCVFFDDYANALVVGPTLRPLTDRFGVSRQKLAYLVDCTAAPVAGLAIMSTWVGYEVGLFQTVAQEAGLERGGYSLLLAALPYRFYCIFALLLVFVSSWWERDFPAMHRAELAAGATRSPNSDRQSIAADVQKWPNAVAPLATLLGSVPLGLLIDGGAVAALQIAPARLLEFSLYREALMASEHNVQVLFLSGIFAATVACVLPLIRGDASAIQLSRAFAKGVKIGVQPLVILVSAWALAGACKDLGTGAFLVDQLQGGLSAGWLPLGSFLLSALVAFCTGTSWGTMAIVVPTVAPVAFAAGGEPLLVIVLASVLDGAIFGDHCSPISDTTVMSCVATGCQLMAHVATQLPYAVCAMMSAAVCGYALVAHGGNIALAYFLGVVLQIGALWGFGRPLSVARRSLS